MNTYSANPNGRQKLPHALPHWVGNDAIFFITVCAETRGQNQFCQPDVATPIFETVEFRHKRGDWFVHMFLLMPDHVHGLISFPRDREMKKTISNWKEIVAKKFGIQWQRDFFDHRLRSDESFEEKARYIRMNPVRQKFVTEANVWPYYWEPTDTK